jgi:uncharacterized protein (TIGR02246 family)
MRNFEWLAVVALALGMTTLTGPVRAAEQGELLQQAQDRAEIEALMWRYVRALDALDADAYAAAFTPDGTFGSGQTARNGRAELKQMVTELNEGRAAREAKGEPATPPMYHVIANHSIEFIDRDHARYHAYWMTVFGAAGEGTTPRVAAAGRSIDMLERVDGEWLIKSRNVAPQ